MTDHRVHLVSLGCPKNRVDSEHMMGQLARAGWTAVAEADEAELLLVNTCAFLDEAQKESIDAILDLAEIKAAHPGRKLVVAGCLAQRHAADLARSMPEVDAFIGTGEYGKLLELIDAPVVGKKGRPAWLADHLEPRWLAPESHTTYLKIAEGCDQACAFCIIPKLRGAQRSRPTADIVKEAQALAAQGAKVQRLLWGSTSTKNPAYRDVLYIEELIGADTVNTVPDVTLKAYLDHAAERARRDRREQI